MTELEAIRARHSVRQYLNRPLTPEELTALRAEADACNRESGLHIQLVTNEPKAFEGSMARYGKFSGVQNYFALVGKAGPDLQEKCGYWGERLVLKAQAMGLNTCWVALTFTKVKSAYTLDEGEKLAARYRLTAEEVAESEPFDLLELIGRRRGMLLSGGLVNTERAAIMVVDEFRGGLWGRITLEPCPKKEDQL